ncbi:jg8353 [Pararge aegeria aegeria]|uniref:Jg8353 protein n=1 Tax=Pararge aegeria aegeria TaxID=348720 RepID=A0A8S4SG97_9NEOP|nr:jg8353 [Pararge aegeria aegeria]
MEKKLKKKAGVPANFINIKESVDSDSCIDFDSDEFEKMIEEENNDNQIQPKQILAATPPERKGKIIAFLQSNKSQSMQGTRRKCRSVST